MPETHSDPTRPDAAPADLVPDDATARPDATAEATFVLDRDLRVREASVGLPVRHWMDLVDDGHHGTAYAAFARALVGPGAVTCRLRFGHPWNGQTLTCTVLRDLDASGGGFRVRVRVARD